MSWKDIEHKHIKQWQAFEEIRTATWLQMKKDHGAIQNSFQEGDIPEHTRKKMEQDIDNWREQWSSGGTNSKALSTMQKEEKDQYLEQYNAFKKGRDVSQPKDPEM